jgi:hypothetical protein
MCFATLATHPHDHCALTTRVYYIYHDSFALFHLTFHSLPLILHSKSQNFRPHVSFAHPPFHLPSFIFLLYFSLLFLSWFYVFSFCRLEHGPESSPAARESGGDAINSCLPLTHERQRIICIVQNFQTCKQFCCLLYGQTRLAWNVGVMRLLASSSGSSSATVEALL